MTVRPLRRLRRMIADFLTPSRPARRRTNLEVEALEDRLTPAAGFREQYMLELINRVRQNPAGELPILLNSTDPDVMNALLAVEQDTLADQWATLTPAPPLAWHDALGNAALAHSQLMFATGQQSHQLPGEPGLGQRIINAGYPNLASAGENIFAFATNVFYAEAAFLIDWGPGPGGIQNPPGHRNNIMNAGYREVGIGIVDAPAGAATGPLLFTQNFANRFQFGNPFLLGSVFDDADNDTFYSQGEGLSGITLTITGNAGTFQTTTSAAGGYQIQVPAGSYQVTASGGTLAGPVSQNVTVGTVNAYMSIIRPQLVTPIVTGPAPSSTDTTPTFSWGPVPDAMFYSLWVDNVTPGRAQPKVIDIQNITGLTYTPPAGLPAGTYQAWVRAGADNGQRSSWSATHNFTINPPNIPILTTPVGATGDHTPTFNWTASIDATAYDLWVNNLTTEQPGVVNATNLATTTFTPAADLPSGNYAAWVQAKNNLGDSAGWSAEVRFSITAPQAPMLTAPTGTTNDTTPTITWTASAGASRYDLWVDNVTTGQSQIIRQQNLTGTSFTPVADLPGGAYKAWIEAFNGLNETGGWSGELNFTINGPGPALPPDPPTLTGPGTTITDTTPTFAWNASAGAATYDLWADNLTTRQSQVVRQTGTTTDFTPANPIPRGNYTFWVRAANGAGQFGPWSAGRNFLIDNAAPPIPAVANLGTTSDLTPTFTWPASAGATRYDLWVNNVSTGQTQVIRQENLATNSFTPAGNLTLGLYRAWVQAFDATNETRGWSGSFDLLINWPPAPSLTGPLGVTGDTTPTLTWSAVAAAVRYDLWLDNVGTNQSQIVRQQNLTTASFTTGVLAPGNYMFWVRCFNANGDDSNWSAGLLFSIL